MKHKILAAAVVMMASAGAQANFNPDGGFDFGGSGAGNVVLSVVELTGDPGNSPYVNVSFGNVSDYLDNTIASGVVLDDNSALDSLISTALGNGNAIQWNVVGIYNAADFSGFGLLTSSQSAPVPTAYTDMSAAVGFNRSWMGSNNTAAGGGNTASGTDALADDGALNGDKISPIGRAGNHNVQGGLGDTLNFFQHFATDGFFTTTGVADLDPLRDFVLSYDATNGAQLSYGAEVAPVPLPAAAWLFASAVLGMVGVARRRAA